MLETTATGIKGWWIVQEHDCIGDVRGLGLFIGIEFVSDSVSKKHAPKTAKWVKEAARERRVLLSTDGPFENVVKIKPPMCFSLENADCMLQTLREVRYLSKTFAVRRQASFAWCSLNQLAHLRMSFVNHTCITKCTQLKSTFWWIYGWSGFSKISVLPGNFRNSGYWL